MIKMTGIAALALLASLSACGSPEQPAEETAPAAKMTMDGPYAESEMTMDSAMKAAVGVDAADTWVKKMIAHRDGAIAMSRIVLGLEPTADVAKMAQMTIENQGAEIEALKALARNGAADPESARLYEAAMTEMHSDMMAASGATPSETYLAKMLAHHRGAVLRERKRKIPHAVTWECCAVTRAGCEDTSAGPRGSWRRIVRPRLPAVHCEQTPLCVLRSPCR